MAIQSFKDLLVWQKARDLTVDIYKAFENAPDFGFKNQIQRASVSIMNNIAEGYARRSDKALRNYLSIARGSTGEVESMLMVAEPLKHIPPRTQSQLLSQTTEVGKLLTAFMSKL